jgi:hypothetical protein
MKLYTEEQVKHAMIEARVSPWLETSFLLADYTPIELPSDDEIIEQLKGIKDDEHKLGFSRGICWAIDYVNQQGDIDAPLSKQQDK